MNKIKRILLLVVMASFLSVGLAGCGNKNNQSSNEQPSKEQPAQEHPSSEHPSGEHPK